MLTARQIDNLPLGFTPVPKTNFFKGKSRKHRIETQSIKQYIKLKDGGVKLITHEAPDNRRKDFVHWKRKSVMNKKDL